MSHLCSERSREPKEAGVGNYEKAAMKTGKVIF